MSECGICGKVPCYEHTRETVAEAPATSGEVPEPKRASAKEAAIYILESLAWRFCHPEGYEWGTPQDVVNKMIADATAKIETVAPDALSLAAEGQHQALKSLSNEIAGILGLEEWELRTLLGNTNVNALQGRLSEARFALAAYQSAKENR